MVILWRLIFRTRDHAHDGVSGLVQRDEAALLIVDDDPGAHAPQENAVARLLDVRVGDHVPGVLHRDDRGLVAADSRARRRSVRR